MVMLPRPSCASYPRPVSDLLLADPAALILVVAGVMLVVAVVPLAVMVRVYRGADGRRPVDATVKAFPPPAGIRPITDALTMVGFVRLGEYEIELPGSFLLRPRYRSSAGPAPGRAVHVCWVFLDAEGTTVAEVAPVGPGESEGLVALTTTMRDGAVVETMFPRGERIEQPDFHSGHVRTSVAAAYDEHRVHVGRFMRHGRPRSVASMRDMLRDDAVYRERFAKRKLRGPLVRNQILPAAAIACAALGLAAYALQRL
jgi:hypothetical protein